MKIPVNIKRKTSSSEMLYFFAYGLFIFRYVILFYSEFSSKFSDNMHNVFYITIICTLVIKMISDGNIKLRKSGVILWMIIVVLGVVIGFHLFELNFVATVLLIGLAYNIDFRKIIKFVCVELSILCVLVFLSCKLGLITDVVKYKGNVARHGLGFTYIGGMGTFYFSILCMILYLKKGKISKKLWCTFLLIELLIYTQDRFVGNLVLTIFLLVGDLLYVIFHFNLFRGVQGKVLEIISYVLSPLLAISAVLLPVLYNTKAFSSHLTALNYFLNGRISIPASVISKYGIHLFGVDIQSIGAVAVDNGVSVNEYNYIDNGFLSIIIRYGLVIGVAVCIAYTKLLADSVKEKNEILTIWCIAILIQSVLYSYLLSIASNPLIILAMKNIAGTVRHRYSSSRSKSRLGLRKRLAIKN